MGTVLSPDYPEGYGNNMNCVWLVISEPGSRIHLAFNDFDLEPPYDFLTVKDGEMPNATVLGRYSGAEVPSHLTSNTHVLQLEFQADHSMSGRGFNITYSSEWEQGGEAGRTDEMCLCLCCVVLCCVVLCCIVFVFVFVCVQFGFLFVFSLCLCSVWVCES